MVLGWKAIRSKKTTHYHKLYYWGSIILAVSASIAYFTGPATAEWIKNNITTYSKDLVENHALWGRIGFIVSILSGLLGVMAISNYAQGERPHKAIPWILFIILLLNVCIFAYTTHLGGLIRRPDLL